MGGPKTRNHSRIVDDLPPDVREMVDRLLIEGKYTYDDIREFLSEKGHDISRSAIGRYGKNYLNFYQSVRIAREQAKTLMANPGDGMILEEAITQGFGKQLVEMLINGDIDLRASTRILSDFAKLQTSSALRERMKAETSKKVEKALENIEAKIEKKHLAPETMKIIRDEFYGLV